MDTKEDAEYRDISSENSCKEEHSCFPKDSTCFDKLMAGCVGIAALTVAAVVICVFANTEK